MTARLSEWQKRTLLAFASVVLTLLVFALGYEVFENIRYYRWKKTYDNFGWLSKLTVPSADSILMWEYRPYGEFNDGQCVIKTNRYGFRDFDYPSKDKPPDVCRIAFAGDSVTLGLGVQEEDTFVRQFAVLAGAPIPGKRLEAMNFSVDGYCTPQLFELLKARVMDFHPDKVVYMMCLNDFDFDDGSGEKIKYFHKPASFTLLLARQLYALLRGAEYFPYYFQRNKKAVFDCIVEMRDFLRERETDFQVVVIPAFFIGDEPKQKPRDKYFKNYPLSGMHGEIDAFMRDAGIPFHDLLEDFRTRRDKSSAYFALDVLHLNPVGHRFIAAALLKPVLSSLTQEGRTERKQ